MASKAAVVDFSKILSSGLGKETTAQLVSFRKRHDDAKRALTALKALPASVDLSHYKSVLKDVVAQAEKILSGFKPVSYDVDAQIKALDSFEAKAVSQAEESAVKLEAELKDLKATLSNIEEARPFDQLTSEDVVAARPEIGKTVEEMVKKGKWSLPGYAEKFGTDDGASFVPRFGRRTSVSAESLTPAYPKAGQEREQARENRAQAPKTENQNQRIRAAVGSNLLFRNLDTEQYNDVLEAMKEVKVESGDVVIKQGDQGDYFYVVESGTLDVYVLQPGATAGDADDLGEKVLSYGPGSSFGELALMYMQPRAASIKATSACTLWALDRLTFRSILVESNYHRRSLYNQLLQHVPLLTHLSEAERLRVSDAIELETFEPGAVVVKEGSEGNHFYVVVNGVAEVHKEGNNEPISTLVRGSYFGELALLNNTTRAATVSAPANEQLQVAKLDASAFTRLLGPLTDIMRDHAREHYGPAAVSAPQAAPNAEGEAPPSSIPEAGDPLSQ
ncbi:hypothetical protein MCUN1_001980 [Malassezia cuniculi]|uniref:ATP synthase subunit d, mitochondrial n=1 Tax=Malassezia cuniculi TaxID=948313 RepID=A0AAF0JBB5_9BASI|nr:hypothetical protein MCUN1_001980 [Malassezia cuniculi]